MKKTAATAADSASARIDARIAELDDWRGASLARMRELIHAADPHVVEEWKWMGTPVFSRDGILCTGESYKDKIKLTFAHGAALQDPKRLFNASLDGGTRRAIDIFRDQAVDATAFKALVREAIAYNVAKKAAAKAKKAGRAATAGKAGKSAKATMAARTKTTARTR